MTATDKWSAFDRLVCSVNAGAGVPTGWWSMVTAYFDESGTHDGSAVAAFAGFVGRTTEWSSFVIQWKLCLEQHGIQGPFHMTDFENRRAAFSAMDDDTRLSLIRRLAEIIMKHDLAGFSICVKTADFYKFVAPKHLGKAADPYYLLLMLAMAEVVISSTTVFPSEKITFVFDKRPKHIMLANIIHSAMLTAWPKLRDLVSDELVLASTVEQIPLQAADILAYESYKRTIDPERSERALFRELKPAFLRVKVMSQSELSWYSFERVLARQGWAGIDYSKQQRKQPKRHKRKKTRR